MRQTQAGLGPGYAGASLGYVTTLLAPHATIKIFNIWIIL